jgi:NAD(P)-dependent dehydrogenase (short-subunit alcohol dehydrogenase family)
LVEEGCARNDLAMQAAGQFDLGGKVAVVTGGSRGIGRAIAGALAHAGADVMIASRKLESCEAAAAAIRAATGRRVVAHACHVGRWSDCDELAEAVYDEFGRCDVLVNNAGMSPAYADLSEVGQDLYDKVHAVNASGPFRLSVRIADRMAQGAGGSIINVSSVSALRPTVADLPYAMAKAALNALTLGLAGAWAPKVRANAVLPSATETDLTASWPAETKARIAQANPMQRLGHPDDTAAVCVFLASDAAGYVNGAQIPVDGGLYRTL